MTKTVIHAGIALTTMIVGSLVTTLLFMLPAGWRSPAQAQNTNLTAIDARPPIVNSENLRHAQNLSDAFHNVAEALRPCVVGISTKQWDTLVPHY